MKSTPILMVLATSAAFSSCVARKGTIGSNGGSGGSTAKSVTINQPDLKSDFISTISDDEKKKIFDNLVYVLSISAVQKDSKDDCNAGITATKFDSGVNAMDKSTFDAIKVNRGCNYVISMRIGQKFDDGKGIKTLLISTWDESQPSILTREELEKPKPVGIAKLFVTADGKKYWNADEMVTPTDTDTTINSSLSKSLKLTAENMSAETGSVFGGINQIEMRGAVEVAPVAATKVDAYCGIILRAVMHNDAVPDQYAYLSTADFQVTGSVIKFPAGSTDKISMKMVGSYIFSPGNNTVTGKSLAYVCSESADVAKEKIKTCAVSGDPKAPAKAGECQVVN